MIRIYPAVTRRGEVRWCQGEEGRLHVTEERPDAVNPEIVHLVCRHCDTLCAIRGTFPP